MHMLNPNKTNTSKPAERTPTNYLAVVYKHGSLEFYTSVFYSFYFYGQISYT